MNTLSGMSFFLILIGTFSVQANTLGYEDKDFACITQQQADKYIRDFSVDVDSFGGNELCDSRVDTKKLLNDLLIIEQGQFDSTQSNLLIKGIVPADRYYAWMKSQTRGMERGNDVPYATAYNRMGNFTMQDGWAKSSTLARVGVVIHEARHTAGYRHYPCTQGPYKGVNLDGCDQDFSQSGSHAVEMEYYARVSVAGQNFHPIYRSMARLMAMGRTNFVFNSSPIHPHEAMLAMDGGSHVPVLFDKNVKLPRGGGDFVGHMKRTSFGAVLFDGIQAIALDVYESTGFKANIEDDYSYFKLLKMAPLGTLKDLEEFDVNQKRYVAMVSGTNELSTYNFPRGTWSAGRSTSVDVVRTTTALPTGEKGYFLIDRNGDVHSVNPENQQVSGTGKSWDSQVVNAVALPGRTMILKTDGVIYARSADGTETAFDQGPYSEMTSVPLYDAFEVK